MPKSKTKETNHKYYVPPKFKFISFNKILNKDQMYRTLDQDGKLLNPGYKQKITDEQLKRAYDLVILSRQQDTYMSQLQRQGRMLTFAPNFGEEVLQVAAGIALEKEDWLVPSFRSNGAMLAHGVPLIKQMRYWNGQEDGAQITEGVNCLPINIVIATQYSHTSGIALALQYQKKANVAMTLIGDGGTSEGEFYEAMNFAGVHKLPAVFCVNNNQWSISTPQAMTTNAETIAQKAIAAGIPGVRVDGNDILASYDVIKQAVEFAREGNGPILVEFVTWRQGVHTSSDNPSIYRTKEEEKKAERWEPIHRFEQYLKDKGLRTDADFARIKAEKLELVKRTYKESMVGIDTKIDDIFDYTYEKITDELAEQKEEAKKYWKENPTYWTKEEVV